MDGGGGAEEELTAQETALYDRQIRVWGVDAQKRLSKAHVLVCGMNGSTIEFCKNIVLAGVGSLSLMDDHMVMEYDLNANFLIPPDESIYGGRSRAEVCCESLKDFNPMVRVAVEKGDPSLIDGEFLDKFDIIVVSSVPLKTKIPNGCGSFLGLMQLILYAIYRSHKGAPAPAGKGDAAAVDEVEDAKKAAAKVEMAGAKTNKVASQV